MSGRESCIWCGEDWPKFYKHKPYCVECASACKRECRTCHKPYPELRFFKDGADRCNTCETKREREQMKKTGGLKLADSLPFRSMSPSSDGESVDGFDSKLSSSERKTNNKRKKRTSNSRRIESETEEEAAAEVGEEDDDDDDGGSNAGDYMDVEEADCNKRVGSDKSEETRDNEDDEDGEVTRRNKKSSSKKVKNVTETLLDYINVGHKKGKKKEVSFELAIKKKKRKSNKKLNGLTGEEASLIEENVVRSLMDYRRAFPGRATVQFFFMNGK